MYIMNIFLCYLWLTCNKINIANAAKIIGVAPFPCKSHAILARALLKELAIRGHDVTLISAFPVKEEVENFRNIYFDMAASKKAHEEGVVNESKFSLVKAYLSLACFHKVVGEMLSDKNVKTLVSSGEKFDLVITLGADSLLGLSHVFNATTIRMSMMGMQANYALYIRNPLPSSYVPNYLLPFNHDMTLYQRTVNTITNLFNDFYMEYFWIHMENSLVQKHFPGAPHLTELRRNVHITFVNSHMAIENVRPHLSNVIQIGGFNLHTTEQLPADLKSFLDSASNGVILFSLGSNLKSKALGDKLDIVRMCLRASPFKILWKDDEVMEGLSDNIKVMKWFPQTAVLSHPNVILFITHGGLGSVQESIFHGVPLLILPFYLDQHGNAAQCVRNGFAIQLDVDTLTEDKLHWAINEMTTNPAYQHEIAVRSDAFRHQEINPMERAVYWVERVIKHKNANYFKCIASHMPLYKYYLFDVYALILLALLAITSISIALVKLFLRFWKGNYVIKIKVS